MLNPSREPRLASRRVPAILLVALLGGACRLLDRAPGPEDPALLAATSGTILLGTASGGLFGASLTAVDLPSLRTLEVRLKDGWYDLGGLDDRGRVLYSPRSSRRHELRLADVETGESTTALPLQRGYWEFRLAPTGGNVVLWEHDGPAVELVDLATRSRRPVTLDVGRVREANWLPDGSAVALDCTLGSVIVDVASAAVRERSSARYGPFSPDGETFLRPSAKPKVEEFELVELASGNTLAAPARFPWSEGYGPHGLCGRNLGLYSALPTEGKARSISLARGGVFVYEDPMLKVCDVVTGAYATLLPHEGEVIRVFYSPARVPALARE